MTSQAGGFRFSFSDDDEAATDVPPSATASPSGTEPTVPLSSFPWTSLSAPTLESWQQHYPASPLGPTSSGPRHTRGGRTTPQQLTLPCDSGAETTREAVICYQTAPELPELTRAGRGIDGSRSTGLDIVPGRYYGGLKVWSCAPDLARYLVAHAAEWRARMAPPLCSAGTPGAGAAPARVPPIVAEVGCGQAIPGLTALLLGARRLLLQDYNAEVLEVCVKPNLAATLLCPANRPGTCPAGSPVAVKLVHGDWADLAWDEPHGGGPGEGGCDVILGSDVTFDETACDKLVDLLVRWLRPQGGVALIATKVYYFGTNGGSLEFTERAVRKGLVVTEAARVDDDGGMKRVILRVTKG